nr:hypothetical protein [Tanacetum cinerariifolium]
MTYDMVSPIFVREYKKVQTLFKPGKDVKEPKMKRVAEETLLQESFKKLKAVEVSGSESTQETPSNDSKEMSEEDVHSMLEIVPVFEFKVEALQVKYPIIDWEIHTKGSRTYWKIISVGGITEAYQSFEDMLKGFDREDLVALWNLVKEKFSSAVPSVDKGKALWVELKRLFEPNADDANDVVQLRALINGKKVVVTEDFIRRDLYLDDTDEVECLPNEEIFAELVRMGYQRPPPKLTFYKAFFSAQWKFSIHILIECIEAINDNKDITLVDVEKDKESLEETSLYSSSQKEHDNLFENMARYKMEHFRAMTYDKVRSIFEREYKKFQTLFKPDKDVEEPKKKRVTEETLLQESFKKLKEVEVSGSESTQENPSNDSKEMSEEDVHNISAVPSVDKEKALWVEFKILFEPDADDVLWKLQRYMHYLITWKLYTNCGVHQVSSTTRRHDMFKLTEKDYPLLNVVMTLMLSAKLQVEEDNEMARNLVMNIFMEAKNQRAEVWKHPLSDQDE